MLGSDVLMSPCCCSGIHVLSVGGLSCIVVSGAVELAD